MIKKYYQSLLSLKYSFPMTAMALIVFAFAWASTNREESWLKTGMTIAFVIELVIMIFYYKGKFSISKQLKAVNNLDEFEKGGMVRDSYLLDDRMLVYDQGKIEEHPSTGFTKASTKENKYGRYPFTLTKEDGTSISLETDSKEQAQHFAAYLKKHNPAIELEGIIPAGTGSLKEFGADYR